MRNEIFFSSFVLNTDILWFEFLFFMTHEFCVRTMKPPVSICHWIHPKLLLNNLKCFKITSAARSDCHHTPARLTKYFYSGYNVHQSSCEGAVGPTKAVAPVYVNNCDSRPIRLEVNNYIIKETENLWILCNVKNVRCVCETALTICSPHFGPRDRLRRAWPIQALEIGRSLR